MGYKYNKGVVDGGVVEFTDLTERKPDMIADPVPNAAEYYFSHGRYELSDKFDTYAIGMSTIRNIPFHEEYKQARFPTADRRALVYRPLMALETINAVVNDYNRLEDDNGNTRTLEDRERLFQKNIFTCTGVAYKKDGGEIKIIHQPKQLLFIPQDYTREFWSINYKEIIGDKINTGEAIFNKRLTKSQVREHPAWKATIMNTADGRAVFKEYTDIMFSLIHRECDLTMGMGFWIEPFPDEDQLRALHINDLQILGDADGSCGLNNTAQFLLVSPQITQKTK
jgi:hypothetical protein